MSGIGHNRGGVVLRIEVRLFNSIARALGSENRVRHLEMPAGSTVGDIIEVLKVPQHDLFLILRNGRDVSPGLAGALNLDAYLDDGDVIALSGPVPYSWGYGAPVV